MILGITGHRPEKLWGYGYRDGRYFLLKQYFKDLIVRLGCTEVVVGMAMGTDIIAAIATLELRDEGYNVKLTCAVPCLNHAAKWRGEDKQLYDQILSVANEVIIVSNCEYNAEVMQERNKFIVKRSDKIASIWDGSNGGTRNCIVSAGMLNREVINVKPSDFK